MLYATKHLVLIALCFSMLAAVPAHAGETSRKRTPSAEKSTTQFFVGQKYTGTSAWYGLRAHGKPTASGKTFDCTKLTAAHRTLPFGTMVRVTNKNNKQSTIVQITDRGPSEARYLIDISRQAAINIGMMRQGSAVVILEILSLPATYAQNTARK